MSDNIFQIENAIVLIIPADIQKLTEGVRESFYYLKGLTELDLVYTGLKPDSKSKITNGAANLTNELQQLEDEIYPNNPDNRLASFPDSKKLKEILKKYILLKEKVDKFQIEILNDLIDTSYITLKKLTEKKKYLEPFLAQIYSGFLIKSAFIHSHSENKKDTYFLLIDGEEKFDNTINPYDNYFNVEVNDYAFTLSRDRTRFQHMYDQLFKLIFSLQEIENKNNLDNLVNKQYSLNRQMVILTYLIAFLTILMTVVGVMQIINSK